MFAFNVSGKPRSGTDLSYERCYFFSCLKVFHTDFHSGLLYTPTVSVQRFSFFIRPCYRKLPAGQRPTFTHIHSLSIWAGRKVSYPEGAYRIYSDLMKQ